MQLRDFNPIDRSRLKFFLARQTAGTKKADVLSPTPAILLTTLALLKDYVVSLKPGEFCRFLGWTSNSFANYIKQLRDQHLAENYQITSDGLQVLAHYANEALVSPEPVETELRENKQYLAAIRIAEGLIDAELGRKLEAALGHQVTALHEDELPSYSWPDVLRAAKKVSDEICETFSPDAILTYPGPSQIFAGLVMATLPPKKAVRLPVYTVILTKTASCPGGFDSIRTQLDAAEKEKEFSILIPKALVTPIAGRQKRIVAIDDTIISGNAMNALRHYFNDPARKNDLCIKFACCVCWDARTKSSGQTPPNFFGKESREPKFVLPWGEGFCFEDALSEEDDSESYRAEL